MSIEAVAWALRRAEVSDSLEHVILIALADHADAEGRGAWPSKATLAEYARCSVRTVHNKLRALEAAGTIVRGDQRLVEWMRADRRPVVYDLPIHGVNEMHPVGHGVNSRVARGEQPSRYGVNAVADKPSLNLTEPSSSPHKPPHDDNTAADAFDAFWEAYPRRTAKQAARKAFAKAARDTDPAVIVEGARRMAADPNLPELTFIPHPATWLNQGRWDDPPYPPRAGRPTTDDRVRDALALAARLDGHGDHPAIGAGR